MLNVRILRERGGVRKSRRSREPVGGECSPKLTGNLMNYVPVTTSKDIRLGRGGGGGGGGFDDHINKVLGWGGEKPLRDSCDTRVETPNSAVFSLHGKTVS